MTFLSDLRNQIHGHTNFGSSTSSSDFGSSTSSSDFGSSTSSAHLNISSSVSSSDFGSSTSSSPVRNELLDYESTDCVLNLENEDDGSIDSSKNKTPFFSRLFDRRLDNNLADTTKSGDDSHDVNFSLPSTSEIPSFEETTEISDVPQLFTIVKNADDEMANSSRIEEFAISNSYSNLNNPQNLKNNPHKGASSNKNIHIEDFIQELKKRNFFVPEEDLIRVSKIDEIKSELLSKLKSLYIENLLNPIFIKDLLETVEETYQLFKKDGSLNPDNFYQHCLTNLDKKGFVLRDQEDSNVSF